MTKSIVPKFLSWLIVSVCLVCVSGPAFAQRGGGGGFHGGGGIRGGGGLRGGGFSGGFRGMPAPRAGGGFVRPGTPGGSRPYAFPGSRSMRQGPWNGAGRPGQALRPPNSNRQWNSFVRRGVGPESGAPPSGIRSGANGGAWQSFGANRAPVVRSGPTRGAATAPSVLEARNSISQMAGLSAIHRSFGPSFGNAGFSNLRFAPNAGVSASTRFSSPVTARLSGTAFGPGTSVRNFFSSDFAASRFGFGSFNRFGNFALFHFHPPVGVFPLRTFGGFTFFQSPFFFDNFFFFHRPFFFNSFFFNRPFFFNNFFFRRPFFGCFGCGFGFGLNFGFGAPLWWGPGWPWWSAGIAYPYGLPYGYSLPYDAGLIYSSPDDRTRPSDNSSASGPSRRAARSAGGSLILLYLKDGTMYPVGDTWLADGKLHYTAMDGSEAVVDLDAIDFQRTVDENAARGAPFTLKPRPNGSAPSR